MAESNDEQLSRASDRDGECLPREALTISSVRRNARAACLVCEAYIRGMACQDKRFCSSPCFSYVLLFHEFLFVLAHSAPCNIPIIDKCKRFATYAKMLDITGACSGEDLVLLTQRVFRRAAPLYVPNHLASCHHVRTLSPIRSSPPSMGDFLSYDALIFPADGRKPHLVKLMASPDTSTDPCTGEATTVSVTPHPEIHMEKFSASSGQNSWGSQVSCFSGLRRPSWLICDE